ncbi:F-box protein At3g07870-like [Bidens hawaiensis]|uniref:F-box protein At3g07870-like n=1 Tax=Bidens hawaiensis TaxID=980011 RepID=UPI00404ABB34
MANTHHIGDDVLRNILARLPGKPLLRFLCVSKHWYGLISDPYFMKSRSRQMILLLLPIPGPLVVIDDNALAENAMARIPYQVNRCTHKISIVGTFNGIVLLALIHRSLLRCELVLFNPLTCASKILVVMNPRSSYFHKFPYVFGFGYGYGETTRDLKIVTFQAISINLEYKYDVFDLKTSSRSTPPQCIEWDYHFLSDVGVFVNGFLYWATSKKYSPILALNVKEMIFSMMKLPDGLEQLSPLHHELPNMSSLLGSTSGCLCMINIINNTRFDLWLMKEQGNDNSWMKAHSFTFALDARCRWSQRVYPLNILSSGKIIMTNTSSLLRIYDTSKHSYKILRSLTNLRDFAFTAYIPSMEYVESLISPSDVCFIYSLDFRLATN